MATSGQIINILSKLGKGLKETEGEERTSKRKEAAQQRKMFLDLNSLFSTAEKKGKKYGGLGNILSGILALTGFGIPLVLAANLAGGLIGGKKGREEAQDYLRDIKGFEGTKFEGDIEQYTEDVGKDYVQSALMDTAMQGMGAAVGGKALETLKDIPEMGKGFTKLFGKTKGRNVLKDLVTKVAPRSGGDISQSTLGELVEKIFVEPSKKILGAPTPLSELSKMTPTKLYTRNLKFEDFLVPKYGKKAAALAQTLGAKAGEQFAPRALTQLYLADKKKKQPSIYGYELPESMASPYAGGRL